MYSKLLFHSYLNICCCSMFQEQYYVLLPRLVARDTNCDTMFSHPDCCYAVHRGLDVVKKDSFVYISHC